MRSESLTRNFDRSSLHRWLWIPIGSAIALFALAFVDQTQQAQAQLGYPNKPIRLVVPYGAGGVGDQTMRLLANKMTERIKQQIIIENRPSAGGILSMAELLRAPADGYTLGEMGNGQAISMSLFSNLRYDLLKDFSPLSVAGTFAILLAVPDRSPYKSLQQLVEDARRNPGKLNLGAINPGSTQNLSAHLFQQITGINATIVPYRTAPDLVTALLRSDVDLGFDYFAALQSVIGPGKVRIIATTGDNRDPVLMDVPTAKESGFPAYVVTSWNGIGTRAGFPVELTKLLNTEINRSLATPDLQEKFRFLGIDPNGTTPEEMWDRMTRDAHRWRDVIEKAGIPKQ
ncbi:MAG TPA: tripartite tricarboxylate transporter substrate-binding protein [Xanthobacteraceae bacterium]|nr:tripartite tricarboxylate transporter substrate-binding protein [Xanthobacteraceae bacterium]